METASASNFSGFEIRQWFTAAVLVSVSVLMTGCGEELSKHESGLEFRDEVDPFAQILQMLGQDARLAVFGEGLLGSGWLGDMARDAQDEIETINMMNDPNGVYASCVECNAFRINQ